MSLVKAQNFKKKFRRHLHLTIVNYILSLRTNTDFISTNNLSRPSDVVSKATPRETKPSHLLKKYGTPSPPNPSSPPFIFTIQVMSLLLSYNKGEEIALLLVGVLGGGGIKM
jgi:hypothetical protein